MINLYNTLTRQKEELRPIKGKTVRVYSCGPTVYAYAHIGNLRSFIFADVLRRTLEFFGYRVRQVMNITDVGHLVSDADAGEDKMEIARRREGKTAGDVAKFYTDAFLNDLARLNVKKHWKMPRATRHIKDQTALIRILEKKGFTYRTSDGIYFDTAKLSDYGKLTGQHREEMAAGARVEINPEKRQPWDFALWKLSAPVGGGHPELVRHTDMQGEGSRQVKRDMEWESPWGTGFPGWHLECSAMSRKYLGQPFDIHTGGIDHISTHHTNEIAQSEAAYGVPLANLWMHGEFLLVQEGRMGKSEGNLITLAEVEKRGFHPLAYRYFTLGAHYRSKLNFTWEALAAAQNALFGLYDTVRDWQRPRGNFFSATMLHSMVAGDELSYEERFRVALADDLNMPEALAVVWELVKSDEPESVKAKALLRFDEVLGLGLDQYVAKPFKVPTAVRQLVGEREEARKAKNWALADELRKNIEVAGFVVEDTTTGPKLHSSPSPGDVSGRRK